MERPDRDDAQPTGPQVDTSSPNVARMYDYFLGGAANFAVDREAAERALAVTPEIGRFARMNRWFLGRVVRYLCDQGIDQFLDLGSGVPTVGNVHEIAHQRNPDARVAYVDLEPVAVAHARALGERARAEQRRAMHAAGDRCAGLFDVLERDRHGRIIQRATARAQRGDLGGLEPGAGVSVRRRGAGCGRRGLDGKSATGSAGRDPSR